MTSIQLLVDSTCDISPDELDKLGINMIPLYVNFGEEEFKDAIDLSSERFFEKLVES
ncbi:MAG: DegV family protein, partial [Candidatus Kariarchaeaceae archaeon]